MLFSGTKEAAGAKTAPRGRGTSSAGSRLPTRILALKATFSPTQKNEHRTHAGQIGDECLA